MLCVSMKWLLGNSRLLVYWISISIAATLTPLLPLHAEQAFPFVAQVTTEGAIYAGPSQDFYVTDRVPVGSDVEVYRQTDDGWCAIRPPQSSFSWLAAEHLEITDNPSLARVINLPVKTRVGSNFDDVHDVEYISLREGEIVELIGSAMLSESPDERGQRWFKISPPAGEFRWIHRSQLKSNSPVAQASNEFVEARTSVSDQIKTYHLDRQPADSPNKLALVAEATELDLETPPTSSLASNGQDTGFVDRGNGALAPASIALVHHEEPIASGAHQHEPHGLTEMKEVQPLKPLSSTLTADVADDANYTDQPEQFESNNLTHVNVMTWEAVSSPTDPLAAPEPRSFVEKYNALNVMLSRAILGEIEEWKLGKLATQSQMLLDQAETASHIELARALADKVTEFQALQQRNSEFVAESADQIRSDTAVRQVAANEAGSKPLPLPEIEAPSPISKFAAKKNNVEMPKRVSRTSPRPMESARELRRTDEVDNSMFDANGTLVVVRSRKAGMPKYAITNKSGQITKFLSTKDGTSLSHLVNKHVGVLGRQGFIRTLQKPHVVAERVVVLQR